MGSDQVDYFPEKKTDTNVNYGEIIGKLCPDYLAMGMTLNEFWDGDADNLVYVREADRLRKQQRNFDAWLQGRYVYEALLCASPMFRDWVKDHHPDKYPEEPYELYPEKKTVSDEQRAEDLRELENQAKVRAWVDRVNRLQAEKQKKEGMSNG